jgi:uncharacterized membrane protein YdjX (TVP38/TMEM64 family)
LSIRRPFALTGGFRGIIDNGFAGDYLFKVEGDARRADGAAIEGDKKGGISRPKALFFLLILLALPLVWRWTPLYAWFNLRTLFAWQASVRDDAAAPLYVAAVYLIGSLVFFPITILNLATLFAFGPLWGNICAFGGWLLSAAEGYVIGRWIGHDQLHKLAGRRLTPLVDRMEEHGFLSVLALRVLPVGPFTLINLFIGAAEIRFRDFFLATVIGRLPGIVTLTLFAVQIENAVRRPGVISFALLGLACVVVPLLVSRWTRRYADRSRN